MPGPQRAVAALHHGRVTRVNLASHGRAWNVDCNDVLGQLADFLDVDAREELCRDIEAHMARCRDCTVEVDTIKKTIVLYQAESGRSFEVPIRVTQRLEEVLAKEYVKSGRGRTD
jgi:hypothetical protein